MRYVPWLRIRTGRLLAILLAALIYLLLSSVDAARFFPNEIALHVPLSLTWARFGFSALVALLFLAIGAFVWLYARSRRIALLLFSFSFTMMATFAVQTGASLNDSLLSAITNSISVFSLLLFLILLLVFPRDYLSQSGALGDQPPSRWRYHYRQIFRWYMMVLTVLSMIVALPSALYHLQSLGLPGWLKAIGSVYFIVVLASILITIIVSYRRSSSLRERQQRRIFVSGVILTFAPFLILTLLPQTLGLPAIDPQISTITFGVLPLTLGYSILRYQILLFDVFVRRAVAWLVGAVGLAVFGYLVVAIGSVVPGSNTLATVSYVALAMALLGPFVWWLARIATEHLFFNEIAHYRRLLDKPELLTRETIDIDGAAQLLTTAAMSAFETQEACLFVFDEDLGLFQTHPALKVDDPADAARQSLIQDLLHRIHLSPQQEVDTHALVMTSPEWLKTHEPIMEIIARIVTAKRPLLLSEVSSDAETPTGLARYLRTTPPLEGPDPLLAPIRAQGKLIAVLVLGERGDRQQYAGPDFEAISLIEARFSPILETARLNERRNRHVATLEALYSGIAKAGETFQTPEEVAVAYTKVATEAVGASAEMWLYNETEHLLHSASHPGTGPHLFSPGIPIAPLADDWSPWFHQGSNAEPATKAPACIPPEVLSSHFPFIWLPLEQGHQHLGVLALVYSGPHLFSQEERRVLGIFADLCASALANAVFTVQLKAAYERQKELDRLKDQFITTASHELRTPLTAVQGYLDLLDTYNEKLSLADRKKFLAKADRGCAELTLIVGNILEAGRVEADTENISLVPVPLLESVIEIVEILEGLTHREQQSIHVDIPANVYVMSDGLRLRQVLLNLVSNAVKYSPGETEIAITCVMDAENATVRIRDQGQGVPPEYQEHIFERFVRLEQNLNSPVRGAGLGLSISKRLIEAMGGRIWVESTGIPNEGSVFAFTLRHSTKDLDELALARDVAPLVHAEAGIETI